MNQHWARSSAGWRVNMTEAIEQLGRSSTNHIRGMAKLRMSDVIRTK
jgi:hypothetical protein